MQFNQTNENAGDVNNDIFTRSPSEFERLSQDAAPPPAPPAPPSPDGSRLATTLALVVILLAFASCWLLTGCSQTNGYLKCRECGSAYKSIGGLGLPSRTCRKCGGTLFWTTKENSGWDEERFQRNGDEIQ